MILVETTSRYLTKKSPDYLSFFEHVHNVCKRGKAVLTLIGNFSMHPDLIDQDLTAYFNRHNRIAMNENEKTSIEFPLMGEWKYLRPPGHHPFAFDFVKTDEKRKNYSK